MLANIQKVQAGLIKYIDSEMINHMDGWKKIGFGASSALIIKNLPNTVQIYSGHPFVQALGIIDEEGNVEIDALHDAVKDYFSDAGEYIDIPLIGRVKFTKSDVETLYQYIKEA